MKTQYDELNKGFLVVVDGKLQTDVFKEVFDSLSWIRAPRKLNDDVKDYWYVGKGHINDGKTELIVKISPSKWMRVVENQLNVYKTHVGLKDWGTSVEVYVGESLMDRVKAKAEELPANKPQKVDW